MNTGVNNTRTRDVGALRLAPNATNQYNCEEVEHGYNKYKPEMVV